MEKRASQAQNTRETQNAERLKVQDLFSNSKVDLEHDQGLKRKTVEPEAANSKVLQEGELVAIKSKYLGSEKEKRKIRKVNDKKFVFDWDAEGI